MQCNLGEHGPFIKSKEGKTVSELAVLSKSTGVVKFIVILLQKRTLALQLISRYFTARCCEARWEIGYLVTN